MFVESNGREELVKCRGKKFFAVPTRARHLVRQHIRSLNAGWRGGERAFPSLIGNTVAVDSGRDGRHASRDKFVNESVREKQREILPSIAQRRDESLYHVRLVPQLRSFRRRISAFESIEFETCLGYFEVWRLKPFRAAEYVRPMAIPARLMCRLHMSFR
jgi:hypothetical protein